MHPEPSRLCELSPVAAPACPGERATALIDRFPWVFGKRGVCGLSGGIRAKFKPWRDEEIVRV